MSAISYDVAPVHVREDLPEAHRRAWERLAAPGAWWSGAERVAIAAEVRQAPRCPLCRERRAALSPMSVEGAHVSLGELSDGVVDVVHRVTTDPGRLSRAWFEAATADALTDAQYVELIGVLVTVVSIDSFCWALGLSSHPLPKPVAGEPTHYRPPGAHSESAWVPMIAESRATGAEADLYLGRRTGNVIRALSLVPDEVRTLLDLSAAHYMAPKDMMDFGARRALDRAQIELIAGRVSALNECFY